MQVGGGVTAAERCAFWHGRAITVNAGVRMYKKTDEFGAAGKCTLQDR